MERIQENKKIFPQSCVVNKTSLGDNIILQLEVNICVQIE